MNNTYSLKVVLKYLVLLFGVCAVMMPTDGSGFLIVVPFVLYALLMKKVDQLAFWMILICSSPTINTFFMPKNMVFAFSFRAIMVCIGVAGSFLMFSRKPVKELSPLFGLFCYLIYMCIPSAQGWAPSVSYMKLLLFAGYYMATIYIATESIAQSRIDMSEFRNVILAFAVFYVFGSVLIYPFPAISLMNARELLEKGSMVASLYKGMTIHSQTLGMVICFWTVFLYVDLIYTLRRPDKLYIALLLCCFFLIYKSSSRTAMGTAVVCMLIATWYLLKMRGIGARWRRKVMTGMFSFLAICFVCVLALPGLRNSVVKFALKYADESSGGLQFDAEYALRTRQFLVDEQMENFSRRPAIGWGFQVSEQVAEMVQHSDGFMLTAPVEKGVWVTAILEEGGLCGEIIYCLYAICALILMVKRRAYFGATIFWAIHISNLGEMTMFSMSGAGGMWYMFLFLALIFDVKRNREMSYLERW